MNTSNIPPSDPSKDVDVSAQSSIPNQPITINQLLLDPSKMPCFRNALLIGLTGGLFTGASYALITSM